MDSLTLAEKTSAWIRTSVVLKLLGIRMLILILLIPMSMLRSLIAEPSALQENAVAEISSKWGGEQTLTGPVLTIPYSVSIFASCCNSLSPPVATFILTLFA